MNVRLRTIVFWVVLSLVAACGSMEKVTMQDAYGVNHDVCSSCAAKAEQFLREGPPPGAFGSDQAAFKWSCPDCGRDMEIHRNGDYWMLRCSRCAPNGFTIGVVGTPKVIGARGIERLNPDRTLSAKDTLAAIGSEREGFRPRRRQAAEAKQ